MIEREHLIEVLTQTKEAIEKENVVKLKEMSNQTIHSASANQDAESIAIAVIVYSLGKLIERKNKIGKELNKFFRKVLLLLDKAISELEKEKMDLFKKTIQKINTEIDVLSSDSQKYIETVFRKAKINKASKIYEHGISMEKTAKLLGLSLWEVANYAGEKNNESSKKINVKLRIKLVEDLFT